MRRITLKRGGDDVGEGADDDVILPADLMAVSAFPAIELLSLYRHRWGIENMFQKVTELLSLKHLIGCSPRAMLFQFSCDC